MSYETLKFERDGRVAIITLNRPEAANSLNMLMSEELVKVATHCDSNPEIRAVILTGSGKMFSAGGDLHSFAAEGEGMSEYMRYTTAGLHVAISRFARMNAPYLVAVNGIAAGAGSLWQLLVIWYSRRNLRSLQKPILELVSLRMEVAPGFCLD